MLGRSDIRTGSCLVGPALQVDTCPVTRRWHSGDRRTLAHIEQQLAGEEPAMAGMFTCWSSTCEPPAEQPARTGETAVPPWQAVVLLVGMVTWIFGPAAAIVACAIGGLIWLACCVPQPSTRDGPPPDDGGWPAGYWGYP